MSLAQSQDVSLLVKKLEKLHLVTSFPICTNSRAPESVFCKDEKLFSELIQNLERLSTDPNAIILLDFQGQHLGSTDGDLCLFLVGLPMKTYVVDAIALEDRLPKLSPYLQDRRLRKIVWDGRLGYSEFWHRYGIRLENVLDLQLVYIHERYELLRKKVLHLSGRTIALKDKNLLSATAIENDLNRRHSLSGETWSARPLPTDYIEFASTQMAHLRLLTTALLPQVENLANILRESKRYVEMWHRARRDRLNRYQTHNYLPQGILERTEEERLFKALGTRKCRGCERHLYQDSFEVDVRRFVRNTEKQYCYTCAKVNLRQYRRARFLDILELAKSRTSSPALVTERTKV